MTYNDVLRIVESGESRTVELKKTTGELKDGMHTACAFLNTDGGWLVFGVAPTRKISGQQVSDKTQQEIAWALSRLEPAVDVRVEYIDVPDKPGYQVIAMYFEGWVSGKEPFTYHGCPYYKVESTTREMPRRLFEERLQEAKPYKMGWDRQVSDTVGVDDLDESKIMNAVRMGVRGGRMPESALSMSVVEILDNFNVLKGGRPLNAAVMLFAGKTSEYPQLMLRMARFSGVDKRAFTDNQRAYGCFSELLDAGVAFCFKHLNLSGKIVGLQREEKLEIPLEALREALVNASCHRRYDQAGTSVGLSIFDDRVEIENPGKFPAELSIETLRLSHKSYPYNQLIADVLYKATWLEGWGTGIDRMFTLCREYGLPEPRYEVKGGFVTVVFPKKSLSSATCGLECGLECGLKLTDRQIVILEKLIADGSKTAGRIAKELGLGLRIVEKDMAVLRKNGFIAKQTKSTHSPWIVLKRR